MKDLEIFSLEVYSYLDTFFFFTLSGENIFEQVLF